VKHEVDVVLDRPPQHTPIAGDEVVTAARSFLSGARGQPGANVRVGQMQDAQSA